MIRTFVERHGMTVLLALAIVRFLLVFESGFRFSRGDYYATLPGMYVQSVNPTLWQSSDLDNIQGREPKYLRGPTQYVTMYPMAYFDSYASIATFLGFAYGLAILFVAEISFRMLRGISAVPLARAPLFIATMCFFPLLQAWSGREFEVVIVAASALAFWAATRNHLGLLGGLLGYIALYKYLPVVALPYLIARRWWRGLLGFAAAGALLIGMAYWLVGLAGFVENHIPGMATGLVTTLTSTKAFCDGPVGLLRFSEDSQDVSLRTALCSLSQSTPLPPAAAYLLIVAIVTGIGLAGFWRLERASALPGSSERWRRVWELSLLVIVSTTFFYSHYYYLGILILPLNALMVQLADGWGRNRLQLALWAAAYLLLAGFLIPPSYAGRVLGVDVWRMYFVSVAYFPGELLLLGLVLHQYVTLPTTAGDAAPTDEAREPSFQAALQQARSATAAT